MTISVITPFYNQAEFPEETILSVLKQVGDFSLEYIVVNDNSPDNGLEIIKKYDHLIDPQNRLHLPF